MTDMTVHSTRQKQDPAGAAALPLAFTVCIALLKIVFQKVTVFYCFS